MKGILKNKNVHLPKPGWIITFLVASVVMVSPHRWAVYASEGDREESRLTPGQATRWKVSGYIQGRLSDEEDAPLEFLVRRARLKATAQFGQEASFTLQLAADEGTVSVKDAVIEYRLPQGLTLELGQRKWNASYELFRSSSLREMPERPTVLRRLFAGERDRGVLVSGTTRSASPIYWAVGLWNGNGIQDQDGELNDFKDLVFYGANLPQNQIPYQGPPQLHWQLSGCLGRARQLIVDGVGNVTGGRDRPKQRLGLGWQYHHAPPPAGNRYTWREGSALKGEVIWGQGYAADPQHAARTWQDVSTWGFWLQETHNLSVANDLVVRYDRFDPSPGASVRTIGLSWIRYLGEVTRGSLTWEQEREGGTSASRLTAQLQFVY